jgi:ribosome biogenesis GTPase
MRQRALNEKQRKELNERLATLDSRERHKLYKRAAQLRKSGSRTEKPKHVARVALDDEEVSYRKPKPVESLDQWVLKLLQQDAPALISSTDERMQGTVIWVGQRACRIRVPGAELNCDLSPDIVRHQQSAIAVGDEVVAYRSEEHLIVRDVLPRRTRLSRPDPGNANIERLLVANVDVIVITVSVKTPPLHPRLIDRYLVAIQRGGAAAAICVNKLDLLDDPAERSEELAKLDPYRGAGVEITTCSTLTHEGMAKLRQVIEGKTCAFVGHSGVGKSSILNALHPELGLLTNTISEGYGRGRHTTTASSLYTLAGGTRLIDTPGIRSFGLWKMEPQELCWYFPEFEGHACKFSDCTHLHEPQCGVKTAVGMGVVSGERYETYKRMLEES